VKTISSFSTIIAAEKHLTYTILRIGEWTNKD